MIKPHLGQALNWFLTLATLGNQSLKDAIYVQAGRNSAAALSAHADSQLIIGLICLGVSTIALLIARGFNVQSSSIKIFRIAILFPAFFAMLICISSMRTTYIKNLASDREDLQLYVSAFISSDQNKTIAANRMAIKDKKTYITYINKLIEIAEIDGITVPKRPFF